MQPQMYACSELPIVIAVFANDGNAETSFGNCMLKQ